MSLLLNSLITHGQIEIIIFGEHAILHEPVERWPIVNCLIAFYSEGFPLDKAIAYIELRKPYCVNDLHGQKLLMDRRTVYEQLRKLDVLVPRHVVLSRDKVPPSKYRQGEDWIEVDGQRMDKPFVEKPVHAEDHNLYIYYPATQGGGGRKLFRKVNNESSRFAPELRHVRDNGSFIYEEFVEPDAVSDIKTYTVGSHVCVQTRKSPAFSGKVLRTEEGREVRCASTLTPEELEMVSRISKAFKQTVCGVDLLRANGRTYVIDVNGWSFVKGDDSETHYGRAATELYKLMRDAIERRCSDGGAPHQDANPPPAAVSP